MFDKEIETLKKQSIKIQQEQLDLDKRVSCSDTLIQQLKKATAEKNFALAAQLM
jgi:septal ring factor EnvC (AmiA/AmiB activator)